MTVELSKAIVDRLHQEVFVGGNFDVVDELVASDFVLHEPDAVKGREEHFGQELPAFHAAFPDLAFSFRD